MSDFYLDARITLVVAAVGHLDEGEISANRVRPECGQEFLCGVMSISDRTRRPAVPYREIGIVGILVQVSDNAQ